MSRASYVHLSCGALFILILLAQCGVCSSAQGLEATASIGNPFLEEVRATNHLPGLVGARIPVLAESSVAVHAVGYRKQGNPTLLTTDDKFHLGSLTKAMTATLIAMLINNPDNNLSWETTVPEAFPSIQNISAGHANTTLAMLGAHFSGISDAVLDPALWATLRNQSVSNVLGRRLTAEKAFSYPPLTKPGTAFAYSNVGYMILGHLLDSHAGRGGSWQALIQEKLWRPLGMTGCGFGTPPERTLQSVDNPWPHMAGDPDPVPVIPDEMSDNPPALGPAGTVHCQAASYAKFLRMHLAALLGKDSPVLPASAFKRLHTPYLSGSSGSGSISMAYTPGAWVVQADTRVNGSYLLHNGSNGRNYAYGLIAPGVGTAFFSATNVGGDMARIGTNEVLLGFFNNTVGF